jgi:hypothetical protein
MLTVGANGDDAGGREMSSVMNDVGVNRNDMEEIKTVMKNFCIRLMLHPEEAHAGEIEALPHVLKMLLSYSSFEN